MSLFPGVKAQYERTCAATEEQYKRALSDYRRDEAARQAQIAKLTARHEEEKAQFVTQLSQDGGVDVVAYDKRPILGGKVVIQAKRYRHTVGVSAVRDLYGTMMNEGANKGILITTSGYGSAAFNFVKDKPIELIEGGGLLYLLENHAGVRARIIMPETAE